MQSRWHSEGSVLTRRKQAVLALLLLLASGRATAASEERAKVVLRSQATLESREVLLSDVADIIAPEPVWEQLRQVSLGSGPVAGTQRTIREDYIRLRLRRYGVDPEAVEMTGGPVVVLSGRVLVKVPPRAPTIPGRGAVGTQRAPVAVEMPVAPAVKRGQLVTVTVICGGVTIHGTGRALSDGVQGELIKVTLEGSNRTIIVQVEGSGETTCLLAPGDGST